MPKFVPNSTLLESISGALGNLVFYRDANGNLIVQQKGERKVPLSQKQLANNDRFKLAALYGRRVNADPALAAAYRPFCRGRMSPYHAALRDFLHPPKVEGIRLQSYTGQPGQQIWIVATDDTLVLSVQVQIRHAVADVVLEQGPAELTGLADQWLYTTTTTVARDTPIVVRATISDRPGNLGTAQVEGFVK